MQLQIPCKKTLSLSLAQRPIRRIYPSECTVDSKAVEVNMALRSLLYNRTPAHLSNRSMERQ